MKKVYYFDDKNEYTEQGFAQLDPLETELAGSEIYLLPASATFDAPPSQQGYAAVWNGIAWELVEDHRGVKYWLPEDKHGDPAREMKELGALPDGASLTEPEKPLDEVKAEKIEELKNERNSREEAPVEYGGKLWDFDTKARDRITTAATALELGGVQSLVWTAHDDTSAELTAADLKGIVATAALRGDALHKKYRELRDRVYAATNREEVKDVIWEKL